ncbi:MAG: DUF1501 domain-containing protein [Planctomycetota bacterium]|nr:DUF1501 domain-containing protein [Planctomycetota bacterium]
MNIQLVHQVDAAVRRGRTVQRRDFLKAVAAGGIAAGNLSITDRFSLQAEELRRRGMSCILLWMAGAPSQFETFSPLAGHANGGETKATKTAVDGIEIAENLPSIAKVMDDIAIVRSVTSKEGNHGRASYYLHTGYLPTPTVKFPSLGSVAAHQISSPESELPSYVRIGNQLQGTTGGGFLGVEFDPFVHRNATQPPANTKPTTGVNRYRRRLRLLGSLQEDYAADGGKTEVENHHKLYEKTARMILSKDMKAFDLKDEPAKVREAYGNSEFASGCLLARRLVETGVSFVEVTSRGWDTHADNFDRHRELTGQIDQPFAELIRDLKDRGMLDRTLVVWMGEFGRTPRINGRAGRDHFPRAFSAALAGGGVRGGQVIGRVTKDGMEVADRPVTVPDLFQSFCKSLKIDADHENMSSIGRPIKIVEEGRCVDELFS